MLNDFLPYPQNMKTFQALDCRFQLSSNCFYSHNGGHWLPHSTLMVDPLTIGGQWRIYSTMNDWEKELYQTHTTNQPTLSRAIIFDGLINRMGNKFYATYPYENTFGSSYKPFFDAMPEGVTNGVWQVEVLNG